MSSDNISELPFLRNIGLVITYKCQIACPHCIIEAGPDRKEEMPVSYALDWINQIAGYRGKYIKVLSLTGGEPFYNLNNLKTLSEFAENYDLIVTVVTNAFWASTKEKATHILKELPAIKMLAISTDVYHQEFIPFERVKNAIMAAKVCNIPYAVAICTENEEDRLYNQILGQVAEITPRENINTAITYPVGRASKNINRLMFPTSEVPAISSCWAGNSPMIFPDGKVIACIGPVIELSNPHPLNLGNLQENSLQEILDRAEINPILHAIRIWGPKKLIFLAKESGYGELLPSKYIKDSICDACYSLMSNVSLVDFLIKLSLDEEFKQKVAYGRLYYLNETRMVDALSQHY